MPLSLKDFEYDLPEELIAQSPPEPRGASRLLQMTAEGHRDLLFRDLPDHLRAGDLLVFNDTRVIKARLRGVKESGGRVEVLIERVCGEYEALAQVRASKSPRAGSRLQLGPDLIATVTGREGDLYRLQFADNLPLDEALERYGEVPLPPYVTRQPTEEDASRYQTVFAREPGAVAAPTAGLHFDHDMLARLQACGVRLAWITLHVGAGTFQPLRDERLDRHQMHSERYSISEATRTAILETRRAGGRIVAVGTTSMRALESASTLLPDGTLELREGWAETQLFILPGYRFKVVDRLITNFHLPRSTLLMLVSAFGGMEPIRRAYAHAVAERYRFFSYGDAMLIDRNDA